MATKIKPVTAPTTKVVGFPVRRIINTYTNEEICDIINHMLPISPYIGYDFQSIINGKDGEKCVKKCFYIMGGRLRNRSWRWTRFLYDTPYDRIPLYINDPDEGIRRIASWRLKLGR